MGNPDDKNVIWRAFNEAGRVTLLWNLVLAVGGVVLLAFVVTNEFLPELDLTGAISLLVSASLISLLLIAFVAVLLFAGGCIIYSWFSKSDANLRGKLSGASALLTASAVYTWVTASSRAPTFVHYSSIALSVALILFLVGFCLRAHFRCRQQICQGCKRQNCRRCQLIYRKSCRASIPIVLASLFVGASFAFVQIQIFVSLYRAGPEVEDTIHWVILWVWLVIQAFCIGVVASSKTPSALFKNSVWIGFFGLLLLLSLSNNPTIIVQRVVQLLAIGSMPNVDLAVTSKGCQALHALSAGRLCTPVSDKTVYMIESVTLKSRFGKQVLVQYYADQGTNDEKRMLYEIVLESKDVLAWQRKKIPNASSL